MTETLTGFEQRLLAELRTVVEQNAAPRRHTLRRLTAVAAGVALVSGALAVGLGRDGPPPAYAVERNPDGSVTVTRPDLFEPRQLQEDLTAAGVPARVVLRAPSCWDADGVLADQSALQDLPQPPVPDEEVFRIRPDLIPPGAFVLVSIIDVPPTPPDVRIMSLGVVVATAVPDCARTP